MEEIKDFKTTMLEMISSDEIENQQELSQVFESFIQDFSHQQKTTYIEKLPAMTKERIISTGKNFKKKPIHKKFLQTKNVIVSPFLWRKIMLAPKRNIGTDFIVSVNNADNVLQFSQLKVAVVNKNPVFILRMAEIKLDSNLVKDPREIMKKVDSKYSLFRKYANTYKLEELEQIVNYCSQFAIHEYLLSEGYVDESALEKATLLYRYERVYHQENDKQQTGHTNYGLPAYYSKVFPKIITQEQLTKESHMHFSEGVGAICRLDDVKEKKNRNNFNAGFAITISKLKDYIAKLNFNNFKDEKEKEFYLKNDFGMPFLYIINRGDAKEVYKILNNCYYLSSPSAQFRLAIKLMDIVGNTFSDNKVLEDEPEFEF